MPRPVTQLVPDRAGLEQLFFLLRTLGTLSLNIYAFHKSLTAREESRLTQSDTVLEKTRNPAVGLPWEGAGWQQGGARWSILLLGFLWGCGTNLSLRPDRR